MIPVVDLTAVLVFSLQREAEIVVEELSELHEHEQEDIVGLVLVRVEVAADQAGALQVLAILRLALERKNGVL